jgi:uncharacterized membrane protein YkoI
MQKTHIKILIALLAIGIMTGATINGAQAEESKDKEASALKLFSQAKITLIDAIKAAEQKTGGKALEAELEDESSTVQFEVEIVKDGRIHEVIVDGNTGKVLKVSLDNETKESAENEKE